MAEATAQTGASQKRRSRGLSEKGLAFWMVSPSMLLIALVAAYPIIYAIWLSLHEYSVRTAGLSRWAGPFGLGNYQLMAERRLRLLMGLPPSDCKLIRPVDEPVLAKIEFDWCQVTDEATTRPDSPHYVDQARLFVEHRFKPVRFDPADLKGHISRIYRP